MREIFETLADELRRAAAEGAEFSNIDDDSVEILERLAGELPPDETLPKSAYARKTPPQDDGEGEFVDDIEEVKFASASASSPSPPRRSFLCPTATSRRAGTPCAK